MGKHSLHRNLPSFSESRRAIALPVNFLILFVSLVLLISATYYFSIVRISAKTQELKISGAEQEMLAVEKVVKFVSWSPGAYQIYEFGDFGGKFEVVPEAKRLLLNLTDDSSFSDGFFNSPVGKAAYELPASEIQDVLYIKGDRRVLVNQSSSTMTQLYISQGVDHYEVALSYRPLAGSAVVGSSNGKPINSLTVYIINLNSSEDILRLGSFRLKVTCANVTSSWRSYSFTESITSLAVKVDLDGISGRVYMPISSSTQGAIVNLETVVCSIKLEDVGW